MDEFALLSNAREAELDPRCVGVVSAYDANFGRNPGYKMEFVGRSPAGGPLVRPSDQCRRVNAGKPFCVKPAKRPKGIFDVVSGGLRDLGDTLGKFGTEIRQLPKPDSSEV